MIGSHFKNIVKKPKALYQTSKFLPKIFYEGKLAEIDNSFNIFIRGSLVTLPTYLNVESIKDWEFGTDEFEDILLKEKEYKFLYDAVNNVLYFLQRYCKSVGEDIKLEIINISGQSFDAATDIMEIVEKNCLLRIYHRQLSKDTDEYVFVEVDRDMNQEIWFGVIIEPSLIK